MIPGKSKHIFLSLAIGSFLVIGLVMLLNGATQVARADLGNWFVSSDGSGDCP